MKTQVAAIEFGTSKIVTLIANSGGLSRCDIIGSGTVPYDGYTDGDWSNPGKLSRAVRDSVSAAELEANAKVREIYVGVPGEYVHICCGEAEIEIAGGVIDEDMINQVQDMVADRLGIADKGGYVLHRSPAWFSVDDGKKSMTPMGVHGARLRASVSFILADPAFIEDMTDLLGELNITILGFLSPTLGESLLLLSLDDRDRAALLIDAGYLNTEVSVVEGDAIIYHAVLPLGGGHITGELMGQLSLPMRAAEQVKRSYVFNADNFDMDSHVEVFDSMGRRISLPREDVQRVIEAVAGDLCEMVNKTIRNDARAFLGSRSNVFLTGGGLALMRGGKDYLSAALESPVKIPTSKSSKLNSPAFSSALGLLDLVFDSIEQQSPAEGSLGEKIKGLFIR